MTRQKKEILRRIAEIEREIEIDRQLSFGIVPDGAHDRAESIICSLQEQLAKLRHYASYEEMMYDDRGAPDDGEDPLPFGEMPSTRIDWRELNSQEQEYDPPEWMSARERLMERIANHMERYGEVLSVVERSNEMTGVRIVNVEWQDRLFEIVQVDGMTCQINRKDTAPLHHEAERRNRITGVDRSSR